MVGSAISSCLVGTILPSGQPPDTSGNEPKAMELTEDSPSEPPEDEKQPQTHDEVRELIQAVQNYFHCGDVVTISNVLRYHGVDLPELDRFTEKYQELSKRNGELWTEMDILMKENTALRREISSLEKEISSLEKEKKNQDVRRRVAEEKRIKQETKRLTQELDTMHRKFNAKVRDCDKQKTAAEASRSRADQAELKAKQTAQEHQRVERELEATIRKRDHFESMVLEKQREAERFRQQVMTLRQEAKWNQEQLEMAKTATSEAIGVQQRLYEMLESAVVKRNDAPNEQSFPTGDQIVANYRESRDATEDYFFALVDLFVRSSSAENGRADNDEATATVLDQKTIFKQVLVPAAKTAQQSHEAWARIKEKQLEALLEDQSQCRNPFTKLFMSSNMQRLVNERLQRDDPNDEVVIMFDEETVRQHPCLEWAASKSVLEHEDLEEMTVGSFVESLTRLQQQCQYSDPPCYLHPMVGETVRFSRGHHKQLITQANRVEANPGDLVQVLFPGLYFEDPVKNPKAKAIGQAYVMAFPPGNEDRQACSSGEKKKGSWRNVVNKQTARTTKSGATRGGTRTRSRTPSRDTAPKSRESEHENVQAGTKPPKEDTKKR